VIPSHVIASESNHLLWNVAICFQCHCERIEIVIWSVAIYVLRLLRRPSTGSGLPRNDINTMKYYCVYIITNFKNSVLYTGVTGELIGRIWYHKNKSVSSFSSKYNVSKLVYFEVYEDVNVAIAREKQIKAGSRKKKILLINKKNPEWKDLYRSLLY